MSERLTPGNPEQELKRFFPKGSIELISGCMFSGKTDALIRELEQVKRLLDINVSNGTIDANVADQVIRAFKPPIDTRYGDDAKLHSHAKTEWPATLVSENSPRDILKYVTEYTRVVVVDEGQFYSGELIDVCEELAGKGVRVIIGALDANFRGETFGIIGDLWARADVKRPLSDALCMVCGDVASKTQRFIVEKDENGNEKSRRPADYNEPEVVVGAADQYEARCRVHHIVPGKPESNNG